MLAANVCAAEFLMKNKHTALFRNHLGPTPEKLATLREQLGLLGLQLGGGDNPNPWPERKINGQEYVYSVPVVAGILPLKDKWDGTVRYSAISVMTQ